MHRTKKEIWITEAIKRIGVSSERLRYWELKGIITPLYFQNEGKRVRRYSMDDVEMATELRRLVEEEGFTLKGAAQRLNRPYKEG